MSRASRFRARSAPLICGLLLVLNEHPAEAAEGTEATSGVASDRGASTTPTHTISLDDAFRAGRQGPGVSLAQAPRPSLERAGSLARMPLLQPPAVALSSGHRSSASGSGLEVALQTMVEVPLRSVSGARSRVVVGELSAVEFDVHRARLDASLRAAVAWSRLREASLVSELRSQSAQRADCIAALASRRAATGVSNPAEAALARGEAGSAHATAIDAEGRRTEAQVELRSAMRLAVDAKVAAIGELCVPDTPLEDEALSLKRAHEANPAIRLAEARARTARTEVDVVRAGQSPTLGVGGSMVREGNGDLVFLGTVALPLPFFERGGFDAARAAGHADVALAQVELVKLELERDLHLAVHERQHTREYHQALLRDATLPLRDASRMARAMFEAGTHDATIVLLAQRRLADVEEQVVRACGEMRRADLRWMRLVGAPELTP